MPSPGLQGGPLMHVIAAKAVALHEALQPSFRAYAHAVVDNAQALAQTLVDMRPKGLTGKAAEAALGRARITCNKNGVPFDPAKPTITSGIPLALRRRPRAASELRNSARWARGPPRRWRGWRRQATVAMWRSRRRYAPRSQPSPGATHSCMPE